MYDVNLYLETTGNRIVRRRRRHYRYVLEYGLRDGGEYTVDGAGSRENASEWEAALAALTDAVGRMRHPGRIHLYTGCRVLLGENWQEWLREWKANGFLTARGEPVKNRGMWERAGEVLEGHSVNVEGTEHAYRKWMLSELEKDEKKGRECTDGVDELEKARQEARSLDPDRWKWPPGMVPLGTEVRETGGRKVLYAYYRDDNTENGEFRYRYASTPCGRQAEAG